MKGLLLSPQSLLFVVAVLVLARISSTFEPDDVQEDLVGAMSFPLPSGVTAYLPDESQSSIILGSPDVPFHEIIEGPRSIFSIASLPTETGKIEGCLCSVWKRGWICTKDLFGSRRTVIEDQKRHPNQEELCLAKCADAQRDPVRFKEEEYRITGENETCNRAYDEHGTEIHSRVKLTVLSTMSNGAIVNHPRCKITDISCTLTTGDIFVKSEAVSAKAECLFALSNLLECTLIQDGKHVTIDCSGFTGLLSGNYYIGKSCDGSKVLLLETSQSVVFAWELYESQKICMKDPGLCESIKLKQLSIMPKLGDVLPSQIMNVVYKADRRITEALRRHRSFIASTAHTVWSGLIQGTYLDYPQTVIHLEQDKPMSLTVMPGAIIMRSLIPIRSISIFDNKRGWARWPIRYSFNGTTSVGFLDLSNLIITNTSRFGILRETALLRVNHSHACFLAHSCSKFTPVMSDYIDPSSVKPDLTIRLESYYSWEMDQLSSRMIGLIAEIDSRSRLISIARDDSKSQHAEHVVSVGLWSLVKNSPRWFQISAITTILLAVLSLVNYLHTIYKFGYRLWHLKEVSLVPKGTNARRLKHQKKKDRIPLV